LKGSKVHFHFNGYGENSKIEAELRQFQIKIEGFHRNTAKKIDNIAKFGKMQP